MPRENDRMPRGQGWWRRWPVDPTYRYQHPELNSAAILDSISLTRIVTDPTTPIHPQAEFDGGSLIDVVKEEVFAPAPYAEPAVRNAGSWRPERAQIWGGFATWKNLSRRPIAVVAYSLCLLAGGVFALTNATTPTSQLVTAHIASQVTPQIAAQLAPPASQLSLPPASGFPVPTPPSLANAPMAPHEVFAYAPYWTLPESSSFALNDVSTLAYFSVDINADGSIDKSGPGWAGFMSQDLSNLVSRAHQAGTRVVLTATDFSQPSLDAITHDPAAVEALGQNLLYLIKEKDLDGVNLDFEGNGSADRAGLDQLVAQVGSMLRAVNPNYQFTMATYGSSASDPDGFYDIRGLAPSVDAFFVMTYDMDNPAVPGPTAPLTGPGYTDESVVSQYLAVVPASKVILGAPLYGYDWPTTGPDLGDAATGRPTAIPYDLAAVAGPTYWDPVTQTPWTTYETNGQWHQIFFDDAASIDMKAQLVANSGLLGIGVWALGMEGSDDSVLTALTGGIQPLQIPPIGSTSNNPTVLNGQGTTTTTNLPSPSAATTEPKSAKCSKPKAATKPKCSTTAGLATTTTTTTSVKVHKPPRTTTTTTTTPAPTTTTSSSTTTTTTPAPTTTTSSSTTSTTSTTTTTTTTTTP
jgi:hypothetical protein